MRRTTPGRHVAREFVERSVVASFNAIFRFDARRTPREAPGRGRAPEPRDQLRATEGDRAGACARRPAGEFRVQGRARAPAVRDVAPEPPAPAPVQALERPGIRYPTRPRRLRLPRDRAGRRYQEAGDLRAHARRVHRGRRGRRDARLDGFPPGQGAAGRQGGTIGDHRPPHGATPSQGFGARDRSRPGGKKVGAQHAAPLSYRSTRNTVGPLGLAEPARGSMVIAAPLTCSPACGSGSAITMGWSRSMTITAAGRVPWSVTNQSW